MPTNRQYRAKLNAGIAGAARALDNIRLPHFRAYRGRLRLSILGSRAEGGDRVFAGNVCRNRL